MARGADRLTAGLLALIAVSAPVSAGETKVHHATGTFEVKITPEASEPAPEGGRATSRMGIAKTFTGGIVGTARGTMLAVGAPGAGQSAAYIAVDQVSGSVDGHAGGFLLLHRGTMTKAGGSDLSVVIAPDSGTGALEGIEGTFSIEMKDGKHYYDLAYTLPSRP